MNLGTFSILGVNVTACDYDFVLDKIYKSLNKPCTVAPVAAHPISEAQQDPTFKKILNSFNYVVPDGYGVIWALQHIHKLEIRKRVYGYNLFTQLLNMCEKKKIQALLIGNDLKEIMNKLKDLNPNLKTKELLDFKGQTLSKKHLVIIKDRLRTNTIDSLLFIGIGSPQQHYLMHEIRKIRLPIIAVGAAFDFLTGKQKQAPIWLQENGLEWFYRMLANPQRFLKRYVKDAFYFLVPTILKNQNGK